MSNRITAKAENKVISLLPKAAISLAMLAISFSAHATLGEQAASVTADQSALHATMTATVGTSYTDYALTLPKGLVVHELVNPAGRVFEVTWSGRGQRPDMAQLLGTYVTRFTRQTQAGQVTGKPTDRHMDRVESDLVIHSAVRNRFFSGTAHIPGMIPDTMSGPVKVNVEVNQ
ncbi:DUF2844 domain-containing protein [Solimicrobium silvestre]|uniref:DUF2844 domain-containing protein n=1 Tax=Solimicrobium silvestre TaxID=2099400 RepID=UPI0013FD1802|nr:DUF2844 domain-containing protein [Solimicrobium silvestre]